MYNYKFQCKNVATNLLVINLYMVIQWIKNENAKPVHCIVYTECILHTDFAKTLHVLAITMHVLGTTLHVHCLTLHVLCITLHAFHITLHVKMHV